MQSKIYDIYISYDHKVCKKDLVVKNIAINLQKELEIHGYSVFIDNNDKQICNFDSLLKSIINNCKVFLLLLTKDSLERCIDNEDLSKKEITEALLTNCKIVNITPDGSFDGWPNNLPKDIEYIKKIQISDISTGSLFKDSIEKLIVDRLPQPLENNTVTHDFEDKMEAAANGDPEAQCSVGDCYFWGEGVEKNYSNAVKWYMKSAKQGNADAQAALAFCYMSGWGIKENRKEAFIWNKAAAIQGNVNGLFNLGIFYKNGYVVEQDYSKAMSCFLQASLHGFAQAEEELGFMYYYGNGVNKNYSKATEWLQKSANKNLRRSQWLLGLCYYYGHGVKKNYFQAIKFLIESANNDYRLAQRKLGMIYYDNHDYTEAVKWLSKAVDQNDGYSSWLLGLCYYYGDGVTKDVYKAAKLYKKAAEQGNVCGQVNLGCCYYNGVGVDLNYYEAVKWFRLAADKENANGLHNLGECYRLGRGIEKNEVKAGFLLKKAKELGYEE